MVCKTCWNGKSDFLATEALCLRTLAGIPGIPRLYGYIPIRTTGLTSTGGKLVDSVVFMELLGTDLRHAYRRRTFTLRETCDHICQMVGIIIPRSIDPGTCVHALTADFS